MLTDKKIRISVIIPTLNESDQISKLIHHIQQSEHIDFIEMLVSDAESTDGTAEIAANCGVKVIKCKKTSRAHQMNEAAKQASGDVLYFVHADVLPPKSFYQDISNHFIKGSDFGCYRFKFDSKHPFLAVNSFFTRFKFLWCRGGDQTLFISKEVFEANNGFDEAYVVMEDFELIKRLWNDYRFVVMPRNTIVSARKYDYNGYWQVNLANLKVFRMFMRGVQPEILKEKYYQLIKHPKDI